MAGAAATGRSSAVRASSGNHFARLRSWFPHGGIMAKNHGNSVKNDKKYEALRDKGYSKERSAKIANSGKSSSRKGGKHSHSH
jgi:hypothetical protein